MAEFLVFDKLDYIATRFRIRSLILIYQFHLFEIKLTNSHNNNRKWRFGTYFMRKKKKDFVQVANKSTVF